MPSADPTPFLYPGTDPEVAAAYLGLAEAALTAVYGFEEELAFVDLETTGFDPLRDSVIEVAVLTARGPEVIERFSTLVKPGRRVPAETTQLTGIDDEMLAEAPGVSEALDSLADVIGDRNIVAHNAAFDRGFLMASVSPKARSLPGVWLDSLELARIALPRMRSHRLRDLAQAFGLPASSHRAADDVEALFGLWRVALAGVSNLPAEVVDALSKMAPDLDWPLRGTLSHMAAARTSPPLDLKLIRRQAISAEKAETMMDAAEVDLSLPEVEEVLSEFSAAGVVGAMYDGFEQREEQVRMAEGVLEAFGEARHLAVEAGTGVGKSVAYLVPASLFALRNQVGVGIATKTNALTDQLVHNELPALREALGGRLRFVSLKGYDHYPCLRKLDRLVSSGIGDRETLVAAATLVAWVSQTPWGDIDSVNIHWPPQLRRAVVCSTEECTKRHCRFHPNLCYVRGVRKRAASAHIVVTNHALLFRDAATEGGILPPLRYWVIDEAHAAESEARKQLSLGASRSSLLSLLQALHTSGRVGQLEVLRGRLRGQGSDLAPVLDPVVDQAEADIVTALTVCESFFDFLKDLSGLVAGSGYDRAELRLGPETRDRSEWTVAAGVGRSLVRRLDAVLSGCRRLITLLEEVEEELSEPIADLVGQVSALTEQRDGLAAVLDGEDESYVYSVSVDRRREVAAESLSASTIDVGSVLAERFFPNAHSVVFTSATLATGDDFSHFAHTVGLDRLSGRDFRTLRLESSYDFERQMAVFVPKGMEEPGGPAYLEQMEELLFGVHKGMGGSVLTLFTNRRDMEALYRRLQPRLAEAGLKLLVQGARMSRKRVRDEFIADEKVSLFATKSFWEGFDARGDTLRCVVVVKLPFGQMADPLYQERRVRDPRAFDRYYLPEAILELKQAAGRLIRSSTDSGCVVVADGRLSAGKAYAGRFLSSLPVRDVELLTTEEICEQIARRYGPDAG